MIIVKKPLPLAKPYKYVKESMYKITYYCGDYFYLRKHRHDGPAVVYKNSNNQIWYRYGRIHREDGPAYITDTSLHWYWLGKIHREDGPAIIMPTAPFEKDKYQYWHNDKYYEIYNEWADQCGLSDEERGYLKLKWK